MLQLEMLPAREGDCLILTYGDPDTPRRVLIDGGRTATYNTDLKTTLDQIPEAQRTFELVVVTHVDRDHIEGILAMLKDTNRPIQFRDLWFNGYDHLFGRTESFGPYQGELLTTEIRNQQLPWNLEFEGRSIETRAGANPIELKGGLQLTILSPTREKLEALIPKWEKECTEAGLMPKSKAERSDPPDGVESFGSFKMEKAAEEPFEKDPSIPNGSSIALLAEYEGKRILLAGDAHADLIIESLHPLAQAAGGRLPLDAFKVSHHGSARNTSRELLELVSCDKYLISTNGSHHGHPDKSALARIVQFGGKEKEFIFNYETPEPSFWKTWQDAYKYRTRYPAPEADGFMKLTL
jgi:hypothetical protein